MTSYHIYRKDTVALVTKKAISRNDLASGVIDSRDIDWISDAVLADLGPLDPKTGKKAAVKLTKVYATPDILEQVRAACPETPVEPVELPSPDWQVPSWR